MVKTKDITTKLYEKPNQYTLKYLTKMNVVCESDGNINRKTYIFRDNSYCEGYLIKCISTYPHNIEIHQSVTGMTCIKEISFSSLN